ncbi:MAG: carboxypeptidase-like regulatory domain-containing protein [Planctomycetota bacterium]
MRASKRLIVCLCLVLLPLGAVSPSASADDEAPALLLTIEATLDGKPLVGAPVRFAPVDAPVLDGEEVAPESWVPVYDALDAPGANVGSRTDKEGRAAIVLSPATSWLVRVGDTPTAQTRLLERGRHASGDTIAFPLIAGEALVRLEHAPLEGWRVVAQGSRVDELEALVVSVARSKAKESPLLLLVPGLGRLGASLLWWHPSEGEGSHAGWCDVGFERLAEAARMPRQPAFVRVEGRLVAEDRKPLPKGSRIRVGTRVPPLATIPLASDGTFRAVVREPAAGRHLGFSGSVHVWAALDGYVASEPVGLRLTGDGGLATSGSIELTRGVAVRGAAPDLAGLPESYRWLLAVRAPPPGQPELDRDRVEIEAAFMGVPSSGWFLARPDGSFETWLTPGAWRIYALLEDHEAVQLEYPRGPYAVVDVGTEAVGDVHVPRWPRVEGRVVDPEGVAIAGAIVSQGEPWHTRIGRTDADGRFSMRRLLAGDPHAAPGHARDGWPLVVQAVGFQRCEVAGPGLEADPLVVRMSAGGDVVVEARTPTGEPVARGGVYQPASEPDPDRDQYLAMFDERGRAHVRGLSVGEHELGVTVGWQASTRVRAEVRPGETSAVPFEAVAPAERRLLRAHMPPGARPEDARAIWFAPLMGVAALPDVATDGSVWFRAPQPRLEGPSALFVEHEGALLAAPWDREPAEAPLEFDAQLLPPRLLHFRFEDPSGSPLYVDRPQPLATVLDRKGDSLLLVPTWTAFRICTLGGFSLFDRTTVEDYIARLHRGVEVQGLEFLVTEAQDGHGASTFVAPTIVPVPAQAPVRLEPLQTLTVILMGPDGRVPFATLHARVERTGELERVPESTLPAWDRVTGRDGKAVVPRDPHRGLVIRVRPTPGLRPLEPIVVPPGASSPLVIRLERE